MTGGGIRGPAAARSWRCLSSGFPLGRIAAILPLLGCSAILDYPAKQATDSGSDFPVDTHADSPADSPADTHVDGDVTDTPPDDVPSDTVNDDASCSGYRVRTANTSISPPSFNAYNASLAWTGSEFGLVWYDGRATTNEVYFARINRDSGDAESYHTVSETDVNSVNPSLVFSGTEYAVAWQDTSPPDSSILFARLDQEGARIGSPTVIAAASSSALYPAIAWSGSVYMVAWHDDRDAGVYNIYFARTGGDGTLLGGETKLNETTASAMNASIAWGGTRFGIAWEDSRSGPKRIYAAIVAPWGNKEGADVCVSTAGVSSFPSIAWSGSEYALLWQDTRAPDSEIFMRTMSGTGAIPGAEAQLTTSYAVAEHPAVVWGGTEVALAWNDDRSTVQQIYFGLADSAGVRIGGDLRVTDADFPADEPSIASTGSEFGVAWSDERYGRSLIYFSIVGPCP